MLDLHDVNEKGIKQKRVTEFRLTSLVFPTELTPVALEWLFKYQWISSRSGAGKTNRRCWHQIAALKTTTEEDLTEGCTLKRWWQECERLQQIAFPCREKPKSIYFKETVRKRVQVWNAVKINCLKLSSTRCLMTIFLSLHLAECYQGTMLFCEGIISL